MIPPPVPTTTTAPSEDTAPPKRRKQDAPSHNPHLPSLPPDGVRGWTLVGFNNMEKAYIQTKDFQYATKLCKNLEEVNSTSNEEEPLRLRLVNSLLPTKAKSLYLSMVGGCSEKANLLLKQALKLPFGKHTPLLKDRQMKRLASKMNEVRTGSEAAKKASLLATRAWKKGEPMVLGFEGPPGVGKTSFLKDVFAPYVGRPVVFVSLGGEHDSTLLQGHGYTYEGSTPGKIAKGLIDSECMDPIFFFDELDKLGSKNGSESISHCLLHLTDPVQNSHFQDRYFQDVPLDLSKASFIFSYNDPSAVNPILMDRIHRVKFDPPSEEEKETVVRNLFFKRELAKEGMEKEEVEEGAVKELLSLFSHEKGYRGVERGVKTVVSTLSLCKHVGMEAILGKGADGVEAKLSGEFVSLCHKEQPGTTKEGGGGSVSHMMMYS